MIKFKKGTGKVHVFVLQFVCICISEIKKKFLHSNEVLIWCCIMNSENTLFHSSNNNGDDTQCYRKKYIVRGPERHISSY